MSTDTTKDPVSVLRAELQMLTRSAKDVVLANNATEAKNAIRALNSRCELARAVLTDTTPAAIQHSEQRETIPAGQLIGYVEPVDVPYLLEAMADGRKTAITLRSFSSDASRATVPLYLGAPVAAPVPEAKAEQVTELDHDTVRQIYSLWKHLGETGMGLYQRFRAAERKFAPAVKHEASELGEELKAAPFSLSPHLAYAVASHVAARQSAPPIAVQGSVGEDAEFRHLLHRYVNARTYMNEAAKVHLSALVKFIDSRSPVAAAPDTSAMDADTKELWKALNDLSFECFAVFGTRAPSPAIYNQTFAVMDKHRAKYSTLSAAAPSADPVSHSRLALNVRHSDSYKAADAFWTYWKENGETHKHGYYESTWGAINQAIRMVGVIERAPSADADNK